MYYIRFTSDIEKDIKKGYSIDAFSKQKLAGLCAWNINDNELNPYSSDDEIIESAKKTAETIVKNTYGGYSSNDTYAILEGTYVGGSRDGVCIKVKRVIAVKYL